MSDKKILLDYGFGEKGFGLYIRQFDKFKKNKLIHFIPEDYNINSLKQSFKLIK